ncbi:MAG: VWA domain-containing protein, partial [Sedimentisphaerales bacterium]|nr:VWA domain-containing protein [Sedimentisphaerales bacterium]
YAALAAVPALLLLYFLKLKRREMPISSTLLWKRAVQDLQVNAPFQRLRKSLLLLLQLLALIAVLAALAGPVLSLVSGSGKRHVILIDRSASMQAEDVSPSRLDEAKKRARNFVDAIRDRGLFSTNDNVDQAMVIAFDHRAKVMCNFTANKAQLKAAINAVIPGDGGSQLGQALTMARAFAQPAGSEGSDQPLLNPAQIVLFSDGQISDLETLTVDDQEVAYHPVGDVEAANIAVETCRAKRSFETPENIDVFVMLVNYGLEAVTSELQLSMDGVVQAVRPVDIPAAVIEQGYQPGRSTINFALRRPEGAVIEARQLHKDALAGDDAAWTILEPPQELTALLVTSGNVPLESALRSCPLARFDTITLSDFAGRAGDMSKIAAYDIIVVDGALSAAPPSGQYLIFGQPPAGIGVGVGESVQNQVIIDWRAQHPLLQHVNLSNFFTQKAWRLTLPREAKVLAELNETPALTEVRHQRSVFILAPFDVMETNWPFEPGFVMFCYNSINYLGTQVNAQSSRDMIAGEPLVTHGLKPKAWYRVIGPGVSNPAVQADAAGSLRFPETDCAGIYRLQRDDNVSDRSEWTFAVNLADARESNLTPRGELRFVGATVGAERNAGRSNTLIWPYLALAALILVCLEWLVYNSRVRL